ncbi:hypothetical protein [Methylobacillus sp.]|uniref:hypothetical protein n=1 Tax=Methylobacillus sp. TaxID=56818 RepID=UPI0012BFFB53|nr:hypothetical protein [Methylobacillus sp.]MPS48499.1 hypothetical protein [Methylobacillus sp.]
MIIDSVLDKYRGVRHRQAGDIQDEGVLNSMLGKLTKMSKIDQQQFWSQDNVAGNVCLYTNSEHPGVILEYVWSNQAKDSITTLYHPHSIFNTRGDLIKARTDLIMEIGSGLQMLPSMVQINDEGRGRLTYLAEMGTMQLIDTLAEVEAQRVNIIHA